MNHQQCSLNEIKIDEKTKLQFENKKRCYQCDLYFSQIRELRVKIRNNAPEEYKK